MKILIANDSGTAHKFIREAFGKALSISGYDVGIWDIRTKPAFDVFDEAEPDIAFLQGYNLTNSVIKCIEERPKLKLVIRVSDWSPWNDELDKKKYPVLSVQPQEIEYLKYLKNLPNSLLLHTHHAHEYIEQTHGNWLKEGFDLYAFENFADVFEYTNGVHHPQFACDLSFTGGFWPYKAVNLNKYIMPLCDSNKNYNIRIFGNQKWPTSKYCGMIRGEWVKHVCKSAKINLSCHEPHSTDFGYDATTKVFNLTANKCFFISDYVQAEKDRFPEGVFCKTPEEYFEKIDHYLANPREREESVETLYERCIKNHTAFERLNDIFTRLDLTTDKITAGKKLVEDKLQLWQK